MDLTLHPDRVARTYLFERRDRYVRPLRYLLFSIAANWFVLDQLHFRHLLGVSEREFQSASFVINHAEMLTLLLLPVLAAIMRCVFHGLRVRYVDALVVLAYTQAQINLLGLLSLAWLAIAGNNLAQALVTVAMAAYLVWAWAGFAQGPAWRRWLAAIATLALGQVLNALVVRVALGFA